MTTINASGTRRDMASPETDSSPMLYGAGIGWSASNYRYTGRRKSPNQGRNMAPPNNVSTVSGSVVRIAIAAALWLALLAIMVFVIPAQRRIFDNFGMQLPIASQVIVDISMWFADYWWVFLLSLVQGLVLAALVTYLVRHRSNNRLLMAVWTMFLIGVPVAIHLLVGFCLLLVRLKLAEALSK
jgi:hypothetical protein